MYKVPRSSYYNTLRLAPQKESSWWFLKGSIYKLLVLFISFNLTSCSQENVSTEFDFQAGDIVLQSLNSSQCNAIREATDSYYTHCGIVLRDGDQLTIYEAIGPVKKSRLQNFTGSGINDHFVVLRPALKDLSSAAKMKRYCDKELGKSYDLFFNWDDTEIYCSELVWKAYKTAGIELCEPRPLKDYDLSSPVVQAVMKQRYGEKIPEDELMVAPSDLFSSTLLEVVYENNK